MVSIARISEVPEEALRLISGWVSAQHGTPLLSDTASTDPAAAAAAVLDPYLQQRAMSSGWAAVDERGEVRALLGASLQITDEDHPGYSFLPERFAQVGLGHCIVREERDIGLLEGLLEKVRADAAEHSITRLMVTTRPHDWLLGSFWRTQGLQPEKWMAGRRSEPIPAVRDRQVALRIARRDDEEQLIALCREEHEYHALHTSAPHRRNQALAPTRRYVQDAFEETDYPRCLVAGDPETGALVGCLFLRINQQPSVSVLGPIMPQRRAFIGLTSVTESWRGRGAGAALTDYALRIVAEHGAGYTFLFYVDSNELSRSFWNRRGFAPVALDLAGEVL